MVKMKVQAALLLPILAVSHIACSEEAKVLKPSPFCQGVMNAIGTNPDETIQKLGKPVSREDNAIKSTHTEGAVDKVSILKYNRARIGFLFSEATGTYILLGAEVTASKFPDNLKAHIPATRDAALAKLGKPEEEQEDPNTLRYFCTTDLNEWVDLIFNPTTQEISSLVFTSHID